jgi:hypothetical protein
MININVHEFTYQYTTLFRKKGMHVLRHLKDPETIDDSD